MDEYEGSRIADRTRVREKIQHVPRKKAFKREKDRFDDPLLGSLRFIPSTNLKLRAGTFRRGKRASPVPYFEIIGSTAELYPRSKRSLPQPKISTAGQQDHHHEWLQDVHPEAYLGRDTFQDFLLDDLKRFSRAPPDNGKPLLALGEMADASNPCKDTGASLLAVACGRDSESLRLVRLNDSQWQWGDFKDTTLNLSVIEAKHEEEQVTWVGNKAPITHIKFASGFLDKPVRWLFVQTKKSTTILQPEYRPASVIHSKESASLPSQAISRIHPNPLLTLSCPETGVNAHSDVVFIPSAYGRPPKIVILDECGNWTIWLLKKKSRLEEVTLHASFYKAYHPSKGLLDQIPMAAAQRARKRGLLQISKPRAGVEVPSTAHGIWEDVFRLEHLLTWNSKRLERVNLCDGERLPMIRFPSSRRSRPERILDVKTSPISTRHVVLLTTKRVYWMDMLDNTMEKPQDKKDGILLLQHPHGFRHTKSLGMSLCQARPNGVATFLMFLHSPKSTLAEVHWYTLTSKNTLKRWHRKVIYIPYENVEKADIQLIQFQPLRLTPSDNGSPTGPGSLYRQEKVQFYQGTFLNRDLSVRYCVSASFVNSKLEISLPTRRVGPSRSVDSKRSRKMRKTSRHQLRTTPVVPGLFADKDSPLLGLPHQPTRNPVDASIERISSVTGPVVMELGGFCRELQKYMLRDNRGLRMVSSSLLDAISQTFNDGITNGNLPLTTWQSIADGLEFAKSDKRLDQPDDTISVLQKELGDNLLVHQPGFRDQTKHLQTRQQLHRYICHLWLDPLAGKLSTTAERRVLLWIEELTHRIFLSTRIMVAPSIRKVSGDVGKLTHRSSRERATSSSTQLKVSQPATPNISSYPALGSSPTPTSLDAAFQRLQMLSPSLRPGELGTTKQSALLESWPTEVEESIVDYYTPVLLSEHEQKVQRTESKQKSQAEEPQLPALARGGSQVKRRVISSTGFPGEPTAIRARPKAPRQIMSSQGAPGSSQGQGQFGTQVPMSQPVAGAFGNRKKVKKKPGFSLDQVDEQESSGIDCQHQENQQTVTYRVAKKLQGMSHCHDEHAGHGGHDHHHEHDHSDDITPALQSSLYEQINFDEIITLNESIRDAGKAVVRKTWAERLETEPELASDADEQLLMTVPFTEQVKLHSILLRTSPSDSAPRTVHLYINRDDLDFSAAEDAEPLQKLELSQTSEVQEIPVKRALFGKVQRLTLFFVDNFGQGDEDVSRISYVGFKGEWTRLGRAPTNILYEAAPQPGDHKLKGTSVNQMGSGIGGRGPGM